MRVIPILLSIIVVGPVLADVVVPRQTMRAGSILKSEDLRVDGRSINGMVDNLSSAIGKEARVALYAGRPIRREDLTAPATIQRNQIVPLIFENLGLSISTGGRALDRGSPGDLIRVMNISSRKTLFGRVLPNGSVDVSNP